MPQKYYPDLDQFERSVCDCKKCVSGCYTMPGSLAPGDIEKIAEHAKPESQDMAEFIVANFAASEGTKILDDQGTPMIVPTIVSQQREDGRCVFLDDEDHCMIHAVSPYGCRNFTVCGSDDLEFEDQQKRSGSHVAAILLEPGHRYIKIWEGLRAIGKLAKPMFERKAAFARMISEIEEKE